MTRGKNGQESAAACPHEPRPAPTHTRTVDLAGATNALARAAATCGAIAEQRPNALAVVGTDGGAFAFHRAEILARRCIAPVKGVGL